MKKLWLELNTKDKIAYTLISLLMLMSLILTTSITLNALGIDFSKEDKIKEVDEEKEIVDDLDEEEEIIEDDVSEPEPDPEPEPDEGTS